MARREEWQEQVKLRTLLDRWSDSSCTFWTATDPVAPSVTSAAMRKKRGVKPGVPDVLVWYRGKSIAMELKSRRGHAVGRRDWCARPCCGRSAVVGVPLGKRGDVALAQSGVPFRTITNEDGALVCWQQLELPAWEVPKRDPHERRPKAPDWEPEELAAETAAPHRRQPIPRWLP